MTSRGKFLCPSLGHHVVESVPVCPPPLSPATLQNPAIRVSGSAQLRNYVHSVHQRVQHSWLWQAICFIAVHVLFVAACDVFLRLRISPVQLAVILVSAWYRIRDRHCTSLHTCRVLSMLCYLAAGWPCPCLRYAAPGLGFFMPIFPPKKAFTSPLLSVRVSGVSVPPFLTPLLGRYYRTLKTNGDGSCALHSIYGVPSRTGLRLNSARSFLASSWGDSAERFRTNVGDPALLEQLETFLWDDVLKPQAKSDAGLFVGRQEIVVEAAEIWREICSEQHVRELCLDRVLQAHQQYESLRSKRDTVRTTFSRICCRSLEHSFVRPLLIALDLLQDFCNTPVQVQGFPEVRNKFDAVFTNSEDGEMYRRSIVESCGVGRFHVLADRVRDIVSDIGLYPNSVRTYKTGCSGLVFCSAFKHELVRETPPGLNVFGLFVPNFLFGVPDLLSGFVRCSVWASWLSSRLAGWLLVYWLGVVTGCLMGWLTG